MTLHFQVKDDDDDYDASSVATEKNLKLFSARSIRKEPFLGDASLGESLTVSDPNPMTSAVCESGGIE